jgi:glycosyltransferase involved in cell wall biosynthesis
MNEPGKINVLYISYDGMTDPLGQSQVIPYLEGLSKEGYLFTLISFEKPDRFEKSSKEVAQRLQKSNIEWVPLNYTKKPPVLSTLYDVWHMKRKAFELHQSRQFKIVHCRSYISALVGIDIKEKLGVKFVFDMRGFYADERLDGGIWKLSNPVYRLVYDYFKQKEKEFLSAADYTVTLTQKAKDVIHTWKEISGQPVAIQVIPCCADLELFSQKSIDKALLEQLRQRFKLNGNEFVISYLGSVGTWYMLDEMLDFFKCLLKSKPDAKFLFITGDNPADLQEKAGAKGIPADALIISPAPHLQVPTYLALSNWSLFFIKPVFSKSASSPTKQGEIMGMGMPHICNAGVGDIDSIVTPETGYVIPALNENEIQKGVDFILNQKLDSKLIVEKAQEVYSLKNGVSKYAFIYRTLLNN